MNLLGKILTILILLLSVCFLMIGIIANASFQNWKEKALANKTLVEQYSRQKAGILEEIEKKKQVIESEKVARMLRIQQLESQLQLAEQNYQRTEEDLRDAQVVSEQRLRIAEQSEQRVKEQDSQITSLQNELRTVIEDVAAQREKVVAITNLNFELEGKIRNLDAIRNDLVSQNALMTKVMNKNGLESTDLTSHIEPIVDGFVLDVRADTIAINLGTDDGMRSGHTVDIHRDGRFVGTAQITIAEANKSAARIDRNLTKFAVEKNDRVTTNWVRTQK